MCNLFVVLEYTLETKETNAPFFPVVLGMIHVFLDVHHCYWVPMSYLEQLVSTTSKRKVLHEGRRNKQKSTQFIGKNVEKQGRLIT